MDGGFLGGGILCKTLFANPAESTFMKNLEWISAKCSLHSSSHSKTNQRMIPCPKALTIERQREREREKPPDSQSHPFAALLLGLFPGTGEGWLHSQRKLPKPSCICCSCRLYWKQGAGSGLNLLAFDWRLANCPSCPHSHARRGQRLQACWLSSFASQINLKMPPFSRT